MDEIEVRPRSSRAEELRKEVEESSKKTKEDFLKYVQDQISRMKSQLHLGDNSRDLTFFELNNALKEYQEINWTLMSLYATAKVEHKEIEEAYETWYADKFVTIRERENRKDMSAQKWASQKELELMVRKETGVEFAQKRKELIYAEARMAFMRRLLESWQSHQYVLGALSKNTQVEASTMGFEKGM